MTTQGRQVPRQTALRAKGSLDEQSVLVVEDQGSLAQMQQALYQQRWGCSVVLASSLAQARDLIAARRFDIAICDLQLPDASQGEIIDLTVAAGIPTVAITAAFGGELRESLLRKGVLDYVLKNNFNAYGYISDLIGRVAHNTQTKILLVDNNESMRTGLSTPLTRLRLEVLTATDGVAALETIAAHPDIRMVITDYNMPRMDGFQLTHKLRERHGKDRLGIIGIAASVDPLLPAQFLKSGANDFIRKPFSFEELVSRVHQNLDMLDLIEENRNAAYQDFLTGLTNRRCFFSEAPQQLERHLRTRQPYGVAVLDIDHFKRINDTWGHDAGDVVLRTIGHLLAAHFPGRLVARLGGEEFAILFADENPADALPLLEHFRAALAATPIAVGDTTITVTISTGYAMTGEAIDTGIQAADTMLYRAKNNGRNRIEHA